MTTCLNPSKIPIFQTKKERIRFTNYSKMTDFPFQEQIWKLMWEQGCASSVFTFVGSTRTNKCVLQACVERETILWFYRQFQMKILMEWIISERTKIQNSNLYKVPLEGTKHAVFWSRHPLQDKGKSFIVKTNIERYCQFSTQPMTVNQKQCQAVVVGREPFSAKWQESKHTPLCLLSLMNRQHIVYMLVKNKKKLDIQLWIH